MDPLHAQANTLSGSAEFVTSETLDKEGERYKRMAIEADPTGMVNALLNRKVARSQWLGKPPSQQIPYWSRS
jgi:hypothetical protein